MENYIQAEDYELWMLIKNGPLIPTVTKEDGKVIIKKPEEFDGDDYKMMEKNAKAKKLLYFGLGLENTRGFLNVRQPRRSGMLCKLRVKVQIR